MVEFVIREVITVGRFNPFFSGFLFVYDKGLVHIFAAEVTCTGLALYKVEYAQCGIYCLSLFCALFFRENSHSQLQPTALILFLISVPRFVYLATRPYLVKHESVTLSSLIGVNIPSRVTFPDPMQELCSRTVD